MSTQVNATASATAGTGPVALLTIAFVVLKLAKIIAWSWWWVLSPLWIAAAFVFALLLIVLPAGWAFFHFVARPLYRNYVYKRYVEHVTQINATRSRKINIIPKNRYF